MPPISVALIYSPRVRLALRALGAVLILFVGADHYYEYSVQQYSVLPTIGTLFLLNFISALVVGLVLLAPLNRLFHRLSAVALQLAAVSGFGIAATSLAALLVSEHTKLFGFMESNYQPAIIVAIASEAAAAVCLALLFVVSRVTSRPGIRPTRLRGHHPGLGHGVR
jgi:hypothetical protein